MSEASEMAKLSEQMALCENVGCDEIFKLFVFVSVVITIIKVF